MLTQDVETREDLACRVSLKNNTEVVRQCDSINCIASGMLNLDANQKMSVY